MQKLGILEFHLLMTKLTAESLGRTSGNQNVALSARFVAVVFVSTVVPREDPSYSVLDRGGGGMLAEECRVLSRRSRLSLQRQLPEQMYITLSGSEGQRRASRRR